MVCKYLDIRADKGGRVIQRKDFSYRCLAPDPVLPPMPASITKAYNYRAEFSRTWVAKEHCDDCPVRVERPLPQKAEKNQKRIDDVRKKLLFPTKD